MSKEAQRVYLMSRMVSRVGDFAFPIAMPNQPFNIPVNAPYGEFHIIEGPRSIPIGGEGRGKLRVRYVGFVQLTIWVPDEQGTAIGTIAEDVFKQVWQLRQGRDASGGQYRFGVIQAFTPQTKVGWECFVVRVPFERDSIEDVTISVP